MSTSGQYTFGLSGGEVIEEGFERAGKDPSSLTADHLESARRSINLLLTELVTEDGLAQYRLDRVRQPLVQGDRGFMLPEGTLDVLDAWMERTDNNVPRKYPLTRMTKLRWEDIGDEQAVGLPTQFYVSKELPTEVSIFDTTKQPIAAGAWGDDVQIEGYPSDRMVVGFWPGTNRTNDAVIYYRLRWAQRVDELHQDIDVRQNWLEAFCAGLAVKLATKWNVERLPVLQSQYDSSLRKAQMENRDRGPTYVSAKGFGRAGRTRRR